jgi:glycosyltransferase involved in cell wall biosynthesis
MELEGSLRILIDGTMARAGGGFTYLVNVIPRLAKLAPQDSFRLLIRNERLCRSLGEAPNLRVDLLPPVGLLGRLRFTHLEIPRLAAEWGADLFFSAGETAPLWAPCPKVAAFRNPNIFTPLRQGWTRQQQLRLDLLRCLARVSAWTCDRIMFVSADSADWIGDRFGIPQERRAVIHHGIDRGAWRPDRNGRVHSRPYILSVSSIYRYKNFVRLIEAYTRLARVHSELPDLVVIGDDQDPSYSARMAAARQASGALAERIHILGEVPYQDIRAWYAGAELFVFPSQLETFGHPLLEAMASEVPLVAADIPVFHEIAGDAALYADPHDASSLAGAMEAALFGLGVREMLVKRGLERVREFTWDRSAHTLYAMFQSLVPDEVRVPGVREAIA